MSFSLTEWELGNNGLIGNCAFERAPTLCDEDEVGVVTGARKSCFCLFVSEEMSQCERFSGN